MVRGCALGALILFVSFGAVAQEAAAGARKVPKAVACNNDDETCRENCTIEFGSSFRTRAKLGTCMETCRTRHHRCTEQWTELHRNNLDSENETKPAATVTTEVVEEVPEPPPPEESPSEEARPYNEGITIPSDEQLAGPAQPGEKPAKRKEEPAPEKKVAAPKPKPPPPPEKKAEEKKDDYDISEWDPDGE